LDFPPKDGHVGLIFSGCDPQDKRKEMGNMLTWKAKGKRLNLTGHDYLPSPSSDEDSEFLVPTSRCGKLGVQRRDCLEVRE